MSVQCTVDGVAIKVGDVVWVSEPNYTHVRRKRLDKIDLGMWWPERSKTIYAHERNALIAAMASVQKRLKKAKGDLAREGRNLAKLAQRLKSADAEQGMRTCEGCAGEREGMG